MVFYKDVSGQLLEKSPSHSIRPEDEKRRCFGFFGQPHGCLRMETATLCLFRQATITLSGSKSTVHMRMVKDNHNKWTIHNTRTKDLELPEQLGHAPEETYVLQSVPAK